VRQRQDSAYAQRRLQVGRNKRIKNYKYDSFRGLVIVIPLAALLTISLLVYTSLLTTYNGLLTALVTYNGLLIALANYIYSSFSSSYSYSYSYSYYLRSAN